MTRRQRVMGPVIVLGFFAGTASIALATKDAPPPRPANADQSILTPAQRLAHDNSPLAKEEKKARQEADDRAKKGLDSATIPGPVPDDATCVDTNGQDGELKDKKTGEVRQIPKQIDGVPVVGSCRIS